MKLTDLTKEQLIEEVKKLKSRKKYGLVWEDKPEDVVVQCKEKLPVLEEVEGKAIVSDKNLPTNLIIEGDNYHALSVLNYTHQRKIDVIYIDPPYNRGNKDFKYNDNYVDIEDTYRHSKWLSFMSKRLFLARELLKSNGIIFISIDDNEYANLKLLCDIIFGENKVETYIWCLQDKTEGSFVKTSKNTVRKEHEYLVACFKNPIKFRKYKTEKNFSEGSFTNPDNDPKGPWFSGNISRNGIKTTTGGKYYTITTPTGVKYTRNWTLSKEEYANLLSKNEIYFSKKGSGVPRLKIYQSSDTHSIQSSLFTDVHTSITGKNELKSIFGGVSPFDFPKPTLLIKRLIEISTIDKNSTILDFFAGTGTTGHAVMTLNKEDGGNRKYILCTNNENRIAEDITYPRIKAVIEGHNDVKGIPANIRYFKTTFVSKSAVSDDTRNSLVRKSAEMICVRENTFERILDNNGYKIYKNGGQLTGILFDLDNIDVFKNELKKLEMPAHIYVFSLTNDTYINDFEDLELDHELCPIPESILEVYRKLFK